MGKTLIIVGLAVLLLGLLVQFLPGGGLPRLPGDIYIKGDNYTFYFPLGWCVLISAILSLGFHLFGK